MTTNHANGKRIEREARLRWVPLAKMRVNPLAQRALNLSRVDKIAAEMDLEQLGTPTVSERDGAFWLIDGQHRVEGYKKWAGESWRAESMQCWTYVGLSETDEAEMFLKLNDTLVVHAFDKFTTGVTAGRDEECDIDRIVRAQGLRISRHTSDGAVGCVAALRAVYQRGGPAVLSRTLRIIRDAYGGAGLEANVVNGVGLVCHRYNGDMSDEVTVARLRAALGGVAGLMNRARKLRTETGEQLAPCVAAAAVEFYNRGKGGKKLKPWWRAEHEGRDGRSA